MDINKIGELLENKEFFEKICKLKTVQDVQKAFKENGLELSIDDIKELEKMNHEALGEVSEQQLEDISGGGAKAYHFVEGFTGEMMPKDQEDWGTIKPKNKVEKIFRTAGKILAWTVGLPAMPITRIIDSAGSYELKEKKCN